jgi:hypothetical protein
MLINPNDTYFLGEIPKTTKFLELGKINLTELERKVATEILACKESGNTAKVDGIKWALEHLFSLKIND